MPFVIFRTDLKGEPKFSQKFGKYLISLTSEKLRIDLPPRPISHANHSTNIDPKFIEIAAKVSVACDITVFGDEMLGNFEDEGGHPNVGASSRYRVNNDGPSKYFSNLGTPNNAEIELLKSVLSKDAIGTHAVLAADIWRYGKYIYSGGFFTEAYLCWIKVMELFGFNKKNALIHAKRFLDPINIESKLKEKIASRLVEINNYRNDYLGHMSNKPYERKVIEKLNKILNKGFYDMLHNFFWDSIQDDLREEDWHHIDVKIIEALSRLCVLQLGYKVPCKIVKTHHGQSLDVLPL